MAMRLWAVCAAIRAENARKATMTNYFVKRLCSCAFAGIIFTIQGKFNVPKLQERHKTEKSGAK